MTDDAISREAVEGLMTNWMFFSPSHKAEAEKELNELPSVQPSRPKGKWLTDTPTATNEYVCSVCGYYHGNNGMNYCPECGAEMGGDE